MVKTSVIGLRIVHGIIGLYFLLCLLYTYACVLTSITRVWLPLAVISMSIEGVAVYIFNSGDCPLLHIQKRVHDETPFFALFLPKPAAKLAISIFSVLALLSFVLLIIKSAGKI